MELEIDRAEAARFLQSLGDPPYTFQTIADADKRRGGLTSKAPHLNGTLDDHFDALARLNQLGAGIFVMVSTGDGKGRLDENVVGIRAVFVDLDGAPVDPVRAAWPRPHMIVQTSPGRYHCYWLVRDFPIADFRPFQTALAKSFNADPQIKDLSRVMRLPGFYHRKKDPQFVCVIESHNGPRYSRDEVMSLLTVPIEEAKPAPVQKPVMQSAPADGREARRRQSYIQNMVEKETGAVANTAQGGRNRRLFEAACNLGAFLHSGEYSEPEAVQLLEYAAQQAGMTEKDDGIAASIASGIRKGKGNPRQVPAPRDNARERARRSYSDWQDSPGSDAPEPAEPVDDVPCDDHPVASEVPAPAPTNDVAAPRKAHAMPMGISATALDNEHELKATLTELSAAHWVKKVHGEDLRYAPELGWLVWDGKCWRVDELAARRRVQDIGRIILDVYNRLPANARANEDVHKAFHAYKKECEKARTNTAIISHLASLPDIDGTNLQWNAHPVLINLPNGVLNLETAELEPHRRDLHLTQMGTTPYDTDTDCPLWKKFLDDIFEGNTELIEYMQWLCWYSLTGSTQHQFFCMLYGGGANGKTTFTNTLRHVLGSEFTCNINPAMLLVQAQRQHSTEFASLFGKRLIIAPETPRGGKMDENIIKRITGEDTISARKLYKDNIEFISQGKLFIATNNKPRIDDTSEGIWRRVQCIPFNRQFKKEEQDPTLMAKLREEAPGILAWMVAGRWRGSLQKMPALPACIREASEDYRKSEDLLGQFLDECCQRNELAAVPSSTLLDAYKRWSGRHNTSSQTFAADMERKGFERSRTNVGVRWIGLLLRNVERTDETGYLPQDEDDRRYGG